MKRRKTKNFVDEVIGRYIKEDPKATCPDITIQVTDDCCLRCTYCYQTHKGHHMMTNETAKQCIDILFQMYDENNEEAYINKHSKGIILDFIGGEPLMNIDTIYYASEYFINECIRRDHQWLTNFKFSICSNGILFFEPKVQEYIKKFKPFLGITITIDGPKELHDACRIDANGEGSFDRAIRAQNAIREMYEIIPETKVTIAPENLPQLNKIIDFFVEQGNPVIFANPIFEHLWTPEEATIYYKQLIYMADIILEDDSIKTELFDPIWGIPLKSTENSNWCGGTGLMLAFDTGGNAYPCLRYMESSLNGEREPLIIGNAIDGIYKTEKDKQIFQELKQITRRSQSTNECFNCHVAAGCAWCSAWNYQTYGTCNKRSTNICWMHRARSLANTYYWNNYYIKTNSDKRLPVYLDRGIATKIISDEEYDKLLNLSFN